MEATLRFSPSFPSQPNQTLIRTRTPTLSNLPTYSASRRRRSPAIRLSISRVKKEQTVDAVKTQLENCHLVAGIHYKGFNVNQFQELRRALPESVHLLVAKNTLVGKAIEGTPWEALGPCMKGMNAWFFVHTEEIPEAIKPYRSFQKEQKLDGNDFVGGVFEGTFYAPDEFKVLETMPSRAEIYAKLLGSLQSPAIGLIGTLQAPAREIVMLLKAHVQKLEEKRGSGDSTAASPVAVTVTVAADATS